MKSCLSIIISLVGILTTVGCAEGVPDAGQSVKASTVSTPLSISPTTSTVMGNQSVPLYATGGTAPYTFRITSGMGTIDSSSGVFIAPTTSGTTQIIVTDQAGATASALITINTSLTSTWVVGQWGSCSATCGGGTQSRSSVCQDSSGAVVANSLCSASGAQPAASQSCNQQACASTIPSGTLCGMRTAIPGPPVAYVGSNIMCQGNTLTLSGGAVQGCPDGYFGAYETPDPIGANSTLIFCVKN